MAYRLDFSEADETSLLRVARERVEDAIDQLDTELENDPEGAVHEARKDVKKARALLRLYRADLDPDTYRRENRALRDAGRELSALRDADVQLGTVDDLADRYAGQLPAAAFKRLRKRVRDEGAAHPAPAAAVDEARARLTRVLADIDDWELPGGGDNAVIKGLALAYARGRKAYARAQSDPTDERLHDWRKRVKDLRYHQQLLRPAWPEVLSAQAKAAKTLSDLLGDDHDLAVLDRRVRGIDGPAAEVSDVLELVAQRREELQAAAFQLGRRVYAEAPKRFGRRIGRYIQTARREARAVQIA
jgi:CHAD domain-containing protein